MSVTRELPTHEWTDFLRAFNGRNYARPVRLESSILAGEGPPLLSAHQPLVGVELDLKGSEAPAITVALGGLDAEEPHFTHVITDPTRLWVEEEPRGRTLGLSVESEDEGETRLLFLQEEALAEASEV